MIMIKENLMRTYVGLESSKIQCCIYNYIFGCIRNCISKFIYDNRSNSTHIKIKEIPNVNLIDLNLVNNINITLFMIHYSLIEYKISME